MANNFGFCLRGRLEGESEQCISFHVQINHVTCSKPEKWLFTPQLNPSKVIEEYFMTTSLGTIYSKM